jgi:hypothetical protein
MAGRTLVDCRAAVGRGKVSRKNFYSTESLGRQAMELLKEIVPSRDASGRRTPVRFASGRLRLATSPIPGDNGEAPLARPGHALAKHMRLAEGQWARQRDSRDRIEDCDLLLLSGLFRRRRLAKDRVDQSLRARQRDHSDAQSAALGTWQHASAGNLKNSFACRCYGCTGAGRLFAGKSSRGGFLSRTSLKA